MPSLWFESLSSAPGATLTHRLLLTGEGGEPTETDACGVRIRAGPLHTRTCGAGPGGALYTAGCTDSWAPPTPGRDEVLGFSPPHLPEMEAGTASLEPASQLRSEPGAPKPQPCGDDTQTSRRQEVQALPGAQAVPSPSRGPRGGVPTRLPRFPRRQSPPSLQENVPPGLALPRCLARRQVGQRRL